MTATALVYDNRFREHVTGPGHPERPERLTAIVDQLKKDGLWQRLEHLRFEPAPLQWIEQLHHPNYVQRLRRASEEDAPYIDVVDSAICSRSYEVALLATGGVLAAADAVMQGQVQNAFCAVRPPGHHAEADRSMGFCLFNHAAIVAHYLIAHHQVERVAIVDIDVHHGNGTQHLFEHRRDVLYISLHEDPAYLYPGTGHVRETGIGPGEGYTVNLPLAPGAGDDDYRRHFQTGVMPALERFQPQSLVVSAGFDAAAQDPLADLRLTREGFRWISQQLVTAAQRHCQGRLISVLEGGYDLDALSQNVSLHVRTLIEFARAM